MKRGIKKLTLIEFVRDRYRRIGDGLRAATGKDDFWDALKWVNYNLPDDVPALDPKEFADVLREYAEYARKLGILGSLKRGKR